MGGLIGLSHLSFLLDRILEVKLMQGPLSVDLSCSLSESRTPSYCTASSEHVVWYGIQSFFHASR